MQEFGEHCPHEPFQKNLVENETQKTKMTKQTSTYTLVISIKHTVTRGPQMQGGLMERADEVTAASCVSSVASRYMGMKWQSSLESSLPEKTDLTHTPDIQPRCQKAFPQESGSPAYSPEQSLAPNLHREGTVCSWGPLSWRGFRNAVSFLWTLTNTKVKNKAE